MDTPTLTASANLEGLMIDQNRLQFVSMLGSGLTDVSIWQETLETLVRSSTYQRQEILTHSRVSLHPSVLSLHKALFSPTHTFLVLAYCPSFDLFTQICVHKTYLAKNQLISHVFIQLLDAVGFCHSNGIAHRDLKPENVLCQDDGQTIFLADFGLSTTNSWSRDFGCGSSFYIAPEVQTVNYRADSTPVYDPFAADVWSLGIILINLIISRNPWCSSLPTDESYMAYVHYPSTFLQAMLPISDQAHKILRRMLAVDPTQRPKIDELKAWVGFVDRWEMGEHQLGSARDTCFRTACEVELVPKGSMLERIEQVRKQRKPRPSQARPVPVLVPPPPTTSPSASKEIEITFHDDFPLFSPSLHLPRRSNPRFNTPILGASPDVSTEGDLTPTVVAPSAFSSHSSFRSPSSPPSVISSEPSLGSIGSSSCDSSDMSPITPGPVRPLELHPEIVPSVSRLGYFGPLARERLSGWKTAGDLESGMDGLDKVDLVSRVVGSIGRLGLDIKKFAFR